MRTTKRDNDKATCILHGLRPLVNDPNVSRWYQILRVQKSMLLVFNDVKSPGQICACVALSWYNQSSLTIVYKSPTIQNMGFFPRCLWVSESFRKAEVGWSRETPWSCICLGFWAPTKGQAKARGHLITHIGLSYQNQCYRKDHPFREFSVKADPQRKRTGRKGVMLREGHKSSHANHTAWINLV